MGVFHGKCFEDRPAKKFQPPPDIVWEEMFTYQPDAKGNIVGTMVKEPVYAPFSGKTLVIWPDDDPEVLQPGFQQQPEEAAPFPQQDPARPLPQATPLPPRLQPADPPADYQTEGQPLPPGQPFPGYQRQAGPNYPGPPPEYQAEEQPLPPSQPVPGIHDKPAPIIKVLRRMTKLMRNNPFRLLNRSRGTRRNLLPGIKDSQVELSGPFPLSTRAPGRFRATVRHGPLTTITLPIPRMLPGSLRGPVIGENAL